MSANAPATTQAVAPSPTQLRRHLGYFATGVTVVTARDADGPVGFACQSFSSVSLDPPLVLFCVDGRSRSWPRIRRAGMFCVNVLAEDQQDLCRRFGSRHGEKFDGMAWTASQWGAPILDDVLVRVHAEVAEVHPAGDHEIVVGRVVELESVRDGRPLVFYRGQFGVDVEEAA
jgi:3-hydroxy-9,10-secoandrosta-1,3,5(10)-triene-9,17-dione monooxygenase reductase component